MSRVDDEETRIDLSGSGTEDPVQGHCEEVHGFMGSWGSWGSSVHRFFSGISRFSRSERFVASRVRLGRGGFLVRLDVPSCGSLASAAVKIAQQ
jgi:hypothetical protein